MKLYDSTIQLNSNSMFSVLAMATGSSLEDLTFVGMVGIIDPERAQVEDAVAQLKFGGVIVKMITGDAEKTAKAIGKCVWFIQYDLPVHSSFSSSYSFKNLQCDGSIHIW